MSAYRGYYEGLRNMYPTAISQLIEAIAKFAVGLALAFAVIKIGQQQYADSQIVFGMAINIPAELTGADKVEAIREQIQLAVAPYTALAATLGVTASTVVGTVILMLRHKIKGDGISAEELAASPQAMSSKALTVKLLKIAIPVSFGSLATNLTTLIDLFSIKGQLNNLAHNHTETMMQMYGSFMPANLPVENIADELWGVYAVSVLSLFNLVPSLCIAFGKSALPNVTACWARKDIAGTKRNIESVLRITSLLAIPAGVGLSVLSKPIMQLLYQSDTAEIGAPILFLLGPACIFVSIITPVYNMLQAVGRVDIPVKLMLLGAVIKTVANFGLVGIPGLNIRGAAIGTILCYGVICVWGIIILCRQTKIKLDMKSVFIKPLIASLLMGGAAWAANGLLRLVLPEKIGDIITLIAILIGGFIYAISLLLLRGISKDDILMLPKGEKIAKVLEKRRIIG